MVQLVIDATVGASTSNSYSDISDADDYFVEHPDWIKWDVLSTPQKERALIMGTRQIDMQPLQGTKNDTGATSGVPDQALHFPTSADVDDGTEFIPVAAKYATYEQALFLSQSGTTGTRSDLQAQGVTRIKIGDVEEEYKGDGGTANELSNRAYQILNAAGLLRWGGGFE
jgi:hypothetical protein